MSDEREAVREVVIVQHESDDPPAIVATTFRDARVPFAVRRLHEGDPLPHVDGCRGLIVLGGEMNVDDDDRHPWLEAERELLRACLRRSVPVLGICLGAQQLAAAAGGQTYRREIPEIGWLPIEVRRDSRLFAGLPSTIRALEWHDYSFHAPPGARLIAERSDGEQAFELGDVAWGVQFHPEVSAEMLDLWIAEDAAGTHAGERAAILDDLRRRRAQVVDESRRLCRTLTLNFISTLPRPEAGSPTP